MFWVLIRLALIGDYRFWRHFRALLVVILVLFVSMFYLMHIWPQYAGQMSNPWVLAVALFAMELFLKVSVWFSLLKFNVSYYNT